MGMMSYALGSERVAMVEVACADTETFVRGGPTLTTFFFVFLSFFNAGKEDSNTTKSGPSSARQRNAI